MAAKSPFGTIGKATDDLRKPSKKTKRAVKRAADKLPSETSIKRFPTLKSYTPAQRKTIAREQKPRLEKLAKDRGYTKQAVDGYRRGEKADPGDILLDNLNAEDRRQVRKYLGVGRTDAVREDAKAFRKFTGARKVRGGEVAQAEALRTYGLKTAVKARGGRKKDRMSFGGTTKIAGVPIPGAHQLGFTADQILTNLTRPANALAGAAYAQSLHDDPLKGAVDSFLQKPGRTKTWGDVLKRKGLGPTSAAIGGVVADIATDPLNVVTLGAAPVAENVIKQSRRLTHAADDLAKAGKSTAAVSLQKRAGKLAKTAEKLPVNKGIQVGVRLPGGKSFRTSGSTSAKLNTGLGGSALSTAIRERPTVQGVARAVLPDFRPAGVSAPEWELARDEQRRARAAASTGSRAFERRARGYQRDLKEATKQLKRAGVKDEHGRDAATQIIDAIERAPKSTGARLDPGAGPAQFSIYGLPAALKPLAHAVRKDLGGIADREVAAGILGTKRRQYVTHALTPKAAKQDAKAKRFGKTNPYAKQRELDLSIREVNAETPNKFDTNLSQVFATRGAKSAKLLADKQFAVGVAAKVGRPFKGEFDELRSIDGVYEQTRHGLTEIGQDKHDIRKALQREGRGELVVLPKPIGDLVLPGSVGLARGGAGLRKFDSAMAKLKQILTTYNLPAYQARNWTGDLWNAYLADTDPKSLLDGARLAATNMRRDGRETKSALDDGFTSDTRLNVGHGREQSVTELLDEMKDQGVIDTGFFGTEIRDFAAHAGDDPGPASIAAAKIKRASPTEKLRRAETHRENSVRAATYLSAKRRGMTPDEAANWTNKHHFDYGDLTDVERNFIRRAIPFYTFSARNTRLQGGKLIQRPGKAANYGLVMEEGRKQAGLPEDYKDRLPDYYRRGLGIPVNIHGNRKLLSPQSPITDLNRVAALTNPGEQFNLTMQQINPVVKNILEVGLNHSMFFRDPLWQDETHPDAPHFTPAPGWLKKLPMSVRVAMAGGDKDAAKQGMWTAKADYFGRLIPQQNTFTQAATSQTGSRNQNRGDALLSQLTGVKINEFDADKFKTNKLYLKRNIIEGDLADLRKLGLDTKPQYERLLAAKRKVQAQIDAARRKAGTMKERRSRGGGGQSEDSTGFGGSAGGSGFGSDGGSGFGSDGGSGSGF